VGGRDLSAEVGGTMFRLAMRLLADDPATDTLLLVSKPPSPDAVRGLAEAAPEGMRTVAAFVGWDGGEAPFEVHPTLEAGVAAVTGRPLPRLSTLDREVDARRDRLDAAGRSLLGLYSGGSLAHEAVTILEPALGRIAGNVGHGGPEADGGHALFDLGEPEYTQGRPHPMVDLDTRIAMLERAAGDPRVGCVLLDLVLGYGSHPDPAAELAPPLRALADRTLVIAHVCGTDDDPQDARRQADALAGAGALLAPSNAAAARLALRALR